MPNSQQLGLAVFDESKSIRSAVDELILAKTMANRRERYVKSLKAYLDQFIRGREDKAISDFKAEEVEGWLSKYSGAYARQTWLNRLSTLFSWAVRRGKIKVNPCVMVERVTVDRHPPVVLTPLQAETLLATVSGLCRPYLILGMFAGIRPEEIQRLDWSAVDLETKTVRVDGKTRHRRIVTLEPNAVDLLKGCALRSGPVTPSAMTLRRFKEKSRAVLGFARWPQDLLRHTSASYMLALHKDAGKVALALGNSAKILMTHYHNPVSESDCQRFWAIGMTKCAPVGLERSTGGQQAFGDGKINRPYQPESHAGIESANDGQSAKEPAQLELYCCQGVQNAS